MWQLKDTFLAQLDRTQVCAWSHFGTKEDSGPIVFEIKVLRGVQNEARNYTKL